MLVLGLATARAVASHLQLTCHFVCPAHLLSSKVFHVHQCDFGALRPSWDGPIAGVGLKAHHSAGFGLVGLMRRSAVSGADYSSWKVALNNDGLSRLAAGGHYLPGLRLAVDAGRLEFGKDVK